MNDPNHERAFDAADFALELPARRRVFAICYTPALVFAGLRGFFSSGGVRQEPRGAVRAERVYRLR